MYNEKIKNILFSCFLLTRVQVLGYTGTTTQDLPSTRANTLSDDADDIQKQLDNEARDKLMYGRPKAMWIFHFPSQVTGITTEGMNRNRRNLNLYKKHKMCNDSSSPNGCDSSTCKDCAIEMPKGWSYRDQGNWSASFPSCGGRFQSPVDVPCAGMISTTGSRNLIFINYDILPKSLTMSHDGNTVIVTGEWENSQRPLIYGGAAYGRRYVFHSLALRWPSDHTVGGLYYPFESQAIHISVEYSTLDEAVEAASKDKLSVLAVSNIYKYSNHSHKGLNKLIKTILLTSYGNRPLKPLPLKIFNPPLKEYAAYQGSLTTPPCTESVLWLVRAKPLPIKRELADSLNGYSADGEPGQTFHRLVQPLNDRKLYFFN